MGRNESKENGGLMQVCTGIITWLRIIVAAAIGYSDRATIHQLKIINGLFTDFLHRNIKKYEVR